MVLGAAAFLWHPPPQWVESAFSNGCYPRWQHALAAITLHLPFALGDLFGLVGVALVIWRTVEAILSRRLRPLLDALAVAGVYALWFYAGWGWGYARPPVQDRLAYDPARVTPATILALRDRTIAEMNRLAPPAHEEERRASADNGVSMASWTQVVQRAGDSWTPRVGEPKPTIAAPFMDATGTSGFINPFSLESQLAPDLLWFERPFSLAHEWSHAAGYNREDEANYIAVVTCLRDPSAIAQYSGRLELFLYLPPPKRYSKRTFVPQVWEDFAALRARNAHFVNLDLSRLSWRVYNRYLQSNHIASGVENYDEVTKLFAGIPLDASGLPIAR
ncbi:MAG: DUF3810 domain-containing protein [Candidatus Eremiobacteraeota bacterium]|nr:DUF3810 domain-containing protein [Candidatus Eremiobacteraeota bacterium]